MQIVLQKTCVQYGKHTVFATDTGYVKHILQRHRLSAYEVCSRLYPYKGNAFALIIQYIPKLFKIEVALELEFALTFKPLL